VSRNMSRTAQVWSPLTGGSSIDEPPMEPRRTANGGFPKPKVAGSKFVFRLRSAYEPCIGLRHDFESWSQGS
jgi:hypothetical protein